MQKHNQDQAFTHREVLYTLYFADAYKGCVFHQTGISFSILNLKENIFIYININFLLLEG